MRSTVCSLTKGFFVYQSKSWLSEVILNKALIHCKVRPTSESFNDPLEVLTDGSMEEYLPVGSQEAPQTIIAKKKFQAQKS